jgi:hypothetical protein
LKKKWARGGGCTAARTMACAKNNNGEAIEKQYGTRGPGTFSRTPPAPSSTSLAGEEADYFLLLADRC